MKRSLIAIAISLIFSTAIPAHAAATLKRVQGEVRVNQGTEFVAAYDQLALQTDDRVMTLDDGKAVIVFDDGCEIEMAPNTLVTVPETSTCAGGVARAQNIAPGGAEAVGAGSSSNWRTALLIALPVAAAAVFIINNDDEPTVSP